MLAGNKTMVSATGTTCLPTAIPLLPWIRHRPNRGADSTDTTGRRGRSSMRPPALNTVTGGTRGKPQKTAQNWWSPTCIPHRMPGTSGDTTITTTTASRATPTGSPRIAPTTTTNLDIKLQLPSLTKICLGRLTYFG